MQGQSSNQVVYTNKARCRDCYRCVRVCPVKAIRMQKGQAFVVEERCISCGTCIRECPQGAKSYRNDLALAMQLVANKEEPVAASIAPSFVAFFSEWERRRLPSALRQLGFSHIAETAMGAYPVAKETAQWAKDHPEQPHLCTACPAVVQYIQKYRPESADYLVPVVSPMVAHARHLKETLGAKVIFIGPCVAKKAEAGWPEHQGVVDCALTFDELVTWFEKEGVDLSKYEESDFDDAPMGNSRLFPLEGGLLKTASLDFDFAQDVAATSGFEALLDALDGLETGIIEPLFCRQGCINGPAAHGGASLSSRRREVLGYADKNPGEKGDKAWKGLSIQLEEAPLDEKEISEDEIRQVLEESGHGRPEDQLNCGACGYPSCRDKAIAVLRGLAEIEMCIPYMRRLAEQRSDRIIETSPNGILMLDERLNIISMNPAFRRFFRCSEAVCGRRISYLMDPEPFERLSCDDEDLIEVTVNHSKYNLITHQLLYPLRENRQYVGIFINITDSTSHQERLEDLKSQTIKQAQDLLEHQIKMAQDIAKFMGESTAKSEELVGNILKIASEADERGNPWDTSMWK